METPRRLKTTVVTSLFFVVLGLLQEKGGEKQDYRTSLQGNIYIPGTCERPLFWGLKPPKEDPNSIQNKGPHFGLQVGM